MKKLIIPLILSTSIQAEVITDGTLSQNMSLPGPNFQITSDLGQQYGSNLFHNFQDFNLNSSESVTFSKSNSIQNHIGNVGDIYIKADETVTITGADSKGSWATINLRCNQ